VAVVAWRGTLVISVVVKQHHVNVYSWRRCKSRLCFCGVS